ncbi:MAG TPA: hypothetical protein VIL46_04135 [Gemmataceae bacterium]
MLVTRAVVMYLIIQVSPEDSAKAWGVLVRHSPGTALPSRTFIVSEEVARALRNAEVAFTEISRNPDVPPNREAEADNGI